jgi:glycine C-acetyltransferase
MNDSFFQNLRQQTAAMREGGTFKPERVLASSQQARIRTADGREVINLCANNYLGLANHPQIISAAKEALDLWGYGLASVRFICGTQAIHKDLEQRLSRFLGKEETILYNSCWDANGGLFETILGPEDAVISDELNHASIIDGIRLCKAKRFRYRNNDMDDLRKQLHEAAGTRYKLIATDGVFSMDGTIANLAEICTLADEHQALVMVDDSHAVGFVGARGRGTHELHGVMDRIDILTGTLGKALGGASGGYTSGRGELIEWLRQRSRTYLFSNTVAPVVVAGAIAAMDLLESSTELRDRLESHHQYFREQLIRRGFAIPAGEHPIVPIMLGDAALAGRFAEEALRAGVYVIGFSYPVVPHGKARIRTQLSTVHTHNDLEQAIDAFDWVRRKLM